MTGKTSVRILIGTLAAIAIGAAVWIISLPNMAECRASGRVVDPTERHCESGATFQQLQEHATLHAVQVVVLFFAALLGAYVLYYIVRKLRGRAVALFALFPAALLSQTASTRVPTKLEAEYAESFTSISGVREMRDSQAQPRNDERLIRTARAEFKRSDRAT